MSKKFNIICFNRMLLINCSLSFSCCRNQRSQTQQKSSTSRTKGDDQD